LAYLGGALRALFGRRFEPLSQRGREFGLAFASALLVHLGLVARLYLTGNAPSIETLLIFGPAAAGIYILVLLSIGPMQRGIARWPVRIVRTLVLNYVAYVFVLDFLRYPLLDSREHIIVYLPFAILVLAAIFLYVFALVKQALEGSVVAYPPNLTNER